MSTQAKFTTITINTNINIIPDKLDKYLKQKVYRTLTQQELDVIHDELEERCNDLFEYPDLHTISFHPEISNNDKIAKIIKDELLKTNKKYFLYTFEGKKHALKIEDTRPNIYICAIHPRYHRKYIPVMKYIEYKQKLAQIEQLEKATKEVEEANNKSHDDNEDVIII